MLKLFQRTPPRVAIIGSCVTRDVWSITGSAAEDRPDLFYLSRTSLASLMAQPAPGFEPPQTPPGDLTPWETRMVVDDILKRGLDKLVAWRPTHLIVDFIDDRFNLLAQGDSVFAHSWEFYRTGLLDTPAFSGFRSIHRVSDEADAIWSDAVTRFAAWKRANLPRTRVILHDARWALNHIDETDPARQTPFENERMLWPTVPVWIDQQNEVLERYAGLFLKALPGTRVVRAPPEFVLGDPRHQWGLSPFHFVPDYYRSVWTQFQRLGCDPKQPRGLFGL